jgi:hypothetical protein
MEHVLQLKRIAKETFFGDRDEPGNMMAKV